MSHLSPIPTQVPSRFPAALGSEHLAWRTRSPVPGRRAAAERYDRVLAGPGPIQRYSVLIPPTSITSLFHLCCQWSLSQRGIAWN